ncbi:MAG: hypothetical protein K5923_02035 [Clostridia bacterium]|nr:hypothetical protein [Clostridia bacterium]
MSNVVLKTLTKSQLEEKFEEFLVASNFKITFKDSSKSEVRISDGIRRFDIFYILKNISSGGWKEKNSIFRIQVSNTKDVLVTTNSIRTHIILGLVEYKGEDILVAWNSYRYVNHKTQRSCYVDESALDTCFNRGYIKVHDFDQETWLCRKENFSLLIRDYLYFNYIGENE